MEKVDFTPLLNKIKNDFNIVLPHAGKKAWKRTVSIKEETDKLLAKKLKVQNATTYGEIYHTKYGAVYAERELRFSINSLSYGEQKLIEFAEKCEKKYLQERKAKEQAEKSYTENLWKYVTAKMIVNDIHPFPTVINEESISLLIKRHASSDFINGLIATLVVATCNSKNIRWDSTKESNFYADLIYIYGEIGRYFTRNIDFQKVRNTVDLIKKGYLHILPANQEKPLDGKVEYYSITWEYVRFDDGYIFVSNPLDENAPALRSPLAASKKSYEYIKSSFVKKMPPIRVACTNGVMRRIADKPMLGFCVMSINKLTAKQIKSPKRGSIAKKDVKELKSISKIGILAYIKQLNSKYLDYLCSLQKPEHVIYYCKENHANMSNESAGDDEDAFIFTTGKFLDYAILVYENANPSRSTYTFTVKSKFIKEAAKEIGNFFSSKNSNKREMLMQKRITFNSEHIVTYYRTMHTDYFSWKNNLPRR